jgi:hypothetical protein
MTHPSINVYGQLQFDERNDGCCQVIEGKKAGVKFLVSHAQFAKAVESAIGQLDDQGFGSLP